MKPKVAVILSGYGEIPRGAEAMIEQLLPKLGDRFDFDMYSLSGKGPGGVAGTGIPRGATEPFYLATTIGRKILDTLYLDPIHIEWTSHLLESMPELRRRNYDVIWHETGRWGGKILANLRRKQGVRLLDVAHSSHPGWELPFARCEPDIFVTADPALAKLVQDELPDLRVEVVRQGVDCEIFSPAAAAIHLDLPRPIALVAGALSPEKNPELGLRAAAQAGLSVVVAGSGPLEDRVDRLGGELLGHERYRRLEASRAEMPGLYNTSDVVVLASPLESGALSILEAMACGRPVVTTADSVRRELVGTTGILVEGQQVDDFAAGISRALQTDWSERPRTRALEFSLDRAAARFGDLLDDLAGARH